MFKLISKLVPSLSMNAKLFTIMGVSWILEIVSAIFPDENVWRLTDLCNSMLGVFVFLIFVVKRRVWIMVKKKLGKMTSVF